MLVFAGCCLYGLNLSGERRVRLTQMEELADMLELLRGELSLRAAALPELAEQLRMECRGRGAAFLEALCDKMDLLGETPFSQIWRRTCLDCCGTLAAQDREELAGLGLYLGRLELERQLQALDRCVEHFRQRIEEERRELPALTRLMLGLSAAAGALLLILLY